MKHTPMVILLFAVYAPMYPKWLKVNTRIFNSMCLEIGGDV